MDNYNYQNYNRPPKRRGIFLYIIVALIAGIIGGIISVYIAPTYLYGKVIPTPEIFMNNRQPISTNQITINPVEEINATAAVAKKAVSSVVGITAVQMQREFFWTRPVEGVGSGVVVNSNGYILTNAHVIGNGEAREINVLFENGDELEGNVLWFDSALDLAILKVNANNVNTAVLGNSDLLEVGELAVAIGNPLGLDFQRSVTSGVISGLHRSIQVDEYNVIEDLIQTDASINPGNSGGPLLNSKGEVIGINTAKIQTGEGLGFSIPINLVKPILEEVIREGGFKNVYIGFTGTEVEVYERQFGVDLKAESGVIVIEVVPGSPADNAGLKVSDVITQMDNEPIESMTNLRKLLYNYRIGDSATLIVNRDGSMKNIKITFNEF
ncbi:trypsin-like peptidase domain-containing protein [Tissierella sp. Yu-01]|uniref:serine protease HtrA n=1 Tax=Tissierella sp. Yu-01 TaxID=3035694 RepID=UPI00240DE950|nr:trypsin-like peptidase domain-containing protein [Tissierella sp. Yu-01]WFA08292.1 trypsin-like peptidase domain-containing protein [Tissierella sp. Yu-01]